MEALKYLTGVGRNVENRLLMFDGEEMDWRSFKIRRVPNCPACKNL
jgi:adenylyltransferase/sulfurtransferase